MHSTLVLTALAAWTTASLVAGPTLPVHMHDQVAHVSAADLEREAGIALKRLPAGGQYVACGPEQCAPLRAVRATDHDVMIPVPELTRTFGFKASFDDRNTRVTLEAIAPGTRTPTARPGVGALVPNLRFTQLDGTTVTLEALRGQRVLINSWASW